MRVLYFHQHFSTRQGATGTRSYEFARRLIERGHSVTMVCGSAAVADSGLRGGDPRAARRGSVDGIDVIQLPLPYSNYDNMLKRAWIFLAFALRCIGLTFTEKYDIIFATSTPLTIAVPGICSRLFTRRPFIFEVRDLWPELPRAMGVVTNPVALTALGALEWLAYHSASHLIGLSPGICEGIRRRGVTAEKITLIPNGADIDLFRPAERGTRSRPLSENGPFIAMFSGAHGLANGLDAALDAAKVLLAWRRDDIKLVFTGDGARKPHLMERARREGLVNCVFLDPVPKLEMARKLAAADAGLMLLANIPSFYYGTSPNKFFDYIACGLPVINNYPGWLADMVAEWHCGIAIPPEDSEAFARALVSLRDNDKMREDMGNNARKLAEKQFDRSALAGQFVDLLERVSRR